MSQFKLKRDRFRKARGGTSKLLEINCTNCGNLVCKYQKDGPGILKRMYLDRIIDSNLNNPDKNLICKNCKNILGNLIVYEKENRLAYRLFVGAVSKKTIKD